MLKLMMSSSDASVEVACSQSNVDVNDVVCRVNTTRIDLGEVEVTS